MSTWDNFNCFDAPDKSDCNDASTAFCDIPEYVTIVIAASMPIITITTRSSTIVKAFWGLGVGKWVLGIRKWEMD